MIAPGPLVGHCSGATGLDVLAPHEAFSLHPLMTVTPQGARFAGAGAAISGASPRGLQTLVLAGKVRALLEGRFNVAFDDIVSVARPALRHRVFLQFEAEADGVTTDQLIDEILEHAKKESSA